ncbi:MAG: metallophosphoesterase [Ignisphaera sp.]|nr:metallophosphoesterase [Ignisphaera sp.]
MKEYVGQVPVPEKKLLLVMSDSHIHERADWFPQEFIDIFKHRKYDVVVHAGDLIDYDVLEFVKSLAKEVYIVQGNMDYLSDLPEEAVFDVFGLRVGVVHGDQVRPRGNIHALTAIAKSLGASILISGHTHAPFVTVHEGVLHVNPGSVTGVWGGGGGSLIPSFIELEISSTGEVTITVYELKQGRVTTSMQRLALYSTG